MDLPDLFRSIGERLAAGASVRNVYGEPVSVGQRTVIPVARVSYSFGAGAGAKPGEPEKSGGGGGGRVSARPCGALEITSEGTRFIGFLTEEFALVLAAGFVLGMMAGQIGR
jgi:uncharacterized spore protein YtfJ